MERPEISAKEWRAKVDSGEIVLKSTPYRQQHLPSTLLTSGEWLQRQGNNYYLFWDYGNYRELSHEEVIEILIEDVNTLRRRYERSTPFSYRN